MTNPLSPAAQAVLNAAEPCDELESAIAAALRAAADQVAPETPLTRPGTPEVLVGLLGERRIIRLDLLAIAAELEAQ